MALVKIHCPVCQTEQIKTGSCIHCGVFFERIPHFYVPTEYPRDSLNRPESNPSETIPPPSTPVAPAAPPPSYQPSPPSHPLTLAKPQLPLSARPESAKPKRLSDTPGPTPANLQALMNQMLPGDKRSQIMAQFLTDPPTVPVESRPADPKEESLWERACQALEQEDPHKEYVAYCIRENLVMTAIRRYSEKMTEKRTLPLLIKFHGQLLKVNDFYRLMPTGGRKKRAERKKRSSPLGLYAIAVSFFCMSLGMIQEPIFKLFSTIGMGLFGLTLMIYLGIALAKMNQRRNR